ncbi:MAG: hypothetical protein IPO36_10360 [Anaerolineales bacterium]|nr:hypothetical protein [Anaerolineales bacterium]
MNKSQRSFSNLLFMLLAFAVAFGLRTYAASRLSIDYDEDDYLRAGQEFAHLIRTDDWYGFLETNYRPEHPQLAKIMFGLSIVNLPEEELIADLPITANPVSSLPPALHATTRGLAAFFRRIDRYAAGDGQPAWRADPCGTQFHHQIYFTSNARWVCRVDECLRRVGVSHLEEQNRQNENHFCDRFSGVFRGGRIVKIPALRSRIRHSY